MNLLLNQPIRDAGEGVWADHTHICAECGDEYVCLEYTEQGCRAKGVFNAIKVNKSGPFCTLCLHLEMARRFLELRCRDQITITARKMFSTKLKGMLQHVRAK